MKLAPLLAQYLYQQKKLALTGIGTFLLDPSARTNADTQHASEGVSFENGSAKNDDESLVNYISAETGKMKALASSDLNSYLELARQFLNIGKPFQIEGIGTLVKNKNGKLDFTADHLLIDRVKETGIKELSATSISDDSLTTYETLKPHSETSPGYKRVFLTFLSIVTVAGIVWIGYRTYKNIPPKTVSSQAATVDPVIPVKSPQPASSARDTTTVVQRSSQTGGPGDYHFVIEVAGKKRAFYRYNILKKGNVPIRISTADSITYKLFFVLHATPADTLRISDSLTTWYPAFNHKRTFAEE